MSQETWEILCGMKTDDVELQLALQCAPLITGLKISNLLTISSDGFCLVAPETAVSRDEKKQRKSKTYEHRLCDFSDGGTGGMCIFFGELYSDAVRTDCQDHGSIQNGERVELSEAGK